MAHGGQNVQLQALVFCQGGADYRTCCSDGVTRCVCCILFGRDGLCEVPQFEGVVFGHGDQTRLDGVEGQRSDAVEVAPQRVFGVPRLPE